MSLRVLVVDDDPADIELLREHMEDAGFEAHLTEASDGIEALDVLHRRGEHEGAARPQLILLDLNMPRMDGLETLKTIRADNAFDDIKIVVLTTSARDADIEATFAAKSNYFVTKPAEPEEFEAVIQLLRDFAAAYLADD